MDNLTFLSGGTGTPKLIQGFRELDPDRVADLSIVVNTGDDLVVSGNLVCPDVDTVLYTLSDRLDRETWYGVDDDTHAVHDQLQSFREVLSPEDGPRGAVPGLESWPSFSSLDEFMKIGDRDRALHMVRTEQLRSNRDLTDVTRRLARALELEARVLPMANEPVPTYVETVGERNLHFQEFWVRESGEPEVQSVQYGKIPGTQSATGEVLSALENPVVIGPSNPVTSIGPILALKDVREALLDTTVLAVSPFREGEAFSGPAARFMVAEGFSPSPVGLAERYEFLDGLIVDETDDRVTRCRTFHTDLWMGDRQDRVRMARTVRRALDELSDTDISC